jgi:hypothetical protein
VQSHQPQERASSPRKNNNKNRVSDSDEYIDPEPTGDFKDQSPTKNGKTQDKKVDILKNKREIKIESKQNIEPEVQKTSSGKKTVQFSNIHQQDSKDSILKMSEQGTRTRNPTPSNESPSSSKKSRTRGPGKKTIERQ